MMRSGNIQGLLGWRLMTDWSSDNLGERVHENHFFWGKFLLPLVIQFKVAPVKKAGWTGMELFKLCLPPDNKTHKDF